MSRSEAYILRTTVHGRRLCPITVEQAEELVKKSEAKLLKAGFYDGTVKAGGTPEQMTRRLTTQSKRSKRS